MNTVQFCPFYIRQMLYLHHTATNLAVFAQYTVCFFCSTCYITTSVGYVFNKYIKVSFKQWWKKSEYVVPRITIVILCLAALPCGDVISFICSVCKYTLCLAPTIMVVLNWINQQDAATSQVNYLSFKYSSTCFGNHHAHHQELQQLQ